MKRVVKGAGIIIAFGLVVYLLGTFFPILFRSAVRRMSCSTETVKIVMIGDLRFEMEDTVCDGIGKDEDMSVYVKDTSLDGKWFFSRWRNSRTLLFTYDPRTPDMPVPSISRPSQGKILISIPEVSEVLYQNPKWANISIEYAVGKVYYPSR